MAYVRLIEICGIFTLLINVIFAQICSSTGQYCIDDKSCCGGCCRNKLCIKTHELCSDVKSKCLSHNCPAGTDCVMYQPSCTGCESIPICI